MISPSFEVRIFYVYFMFISGDPNDKSLRKVEKDVLVPKLMRERTKSEKCVNEVKGNLFGQIT